MSEKAIYSLLKNYAPLTAIVPVAKIYSSIIPQDAVLPAIAYSHISTVENTTIDANSAYGLVTSRIQVSVATKDYPQLKDIISLIRKACNYNRGTINGVIVNSIVRELIGPDLRDDESKVYFQSIDFRVVYHELN